MAQFFTVASLLALTAWLGRRYADRLSATLRRQMGSMRAERAGDRDRIARPIYKASAHEFLHGAADLTFGVLILGLGFFLLMWMIATG